MKMIAYRAGIKVGQGSYWNPDDGAYITFDEPGRMLPGDERTTYIKMTSLRSMVIAPLFGMMYVLFLPLFGVAAFVVTAAARALCAAGSITSSGLRVCGVLASISTRLNWRPSQAYLSGVRKHRRSGGCGCPGPRGR